MARDPNGTGAAEVEALRSAGYDDGQIAALTMFVALRIAFSTVNDALGARPGPELVASAPAAVRDAVTYGRRASPEPSARCGGLLRRHGCGDEGNRTPNPRLAKAVLCQFGSVPGGSVWVAQGADGGLTA